MTYIPLSSKPIGEIVADNYRTADVFRKYNIDFCCGGKVSLHQICQKKNLQEQQIISELEEVSSIHPDRNQNYRDWDISFLADYIEQQHHSYVSQSIPVILQYARKVASVHGDHRPETVKIFELFTEAASELLSHMEKEEKILFPHIRELSRALKQSGTIPPPPFRSVQNPIRMMEMEHEQAGELLNRINQLSTGYKAPAEACNTYRVLYAKLKEFEDDLHQHVHLENNILFPKSMDAETRVMPHLV